MKGLHNMAYIEVKGECKRYHMGETVITANDHVSFDVEKGELAFGLVAPAVRHHRGAA